MEVRLESASHESIGIMLANLCQLIYVQKWHKAQNQWNMAAIGHYPLGWIKWTPIPGDPRELVPTDRGRMKGQRILTWRKVVQTNCFGQRVKENPGDNSLAARYNRKGIRLPCKHCYIQGMVERAKTDTKVFEECYRAFKWVWRAWIKRQATKSNKKW